MRALAIIGVLSSLGGCVEVPDRSFDRQLGGDAAAPREDGEAPAGDARPGDAARTDGDPRATRALPDARAPTTAGRPAHRRRPARRRG
ncbi:MAG: hypothetical protein H6704_13020 [Myxococcales bacterium]|nr:hypothetical protein [Myxococcales bacterium]